MRNKPPARVVTERRCEEWSMRLILRERNMAILSGQ